MHICISDVIICAYNLLTWFPSATFSIRDLTYLENFLAVYGWIVEWKPELRQVLEHLARLCVAEREESERAGTEIIEGTSLLRLFANLVRIDFIMCYCQLTWTS